VDVDRQQLDKFFSSRFSWAIPWSRISLLENGWPLALGRLLCKDNNATTIWLFKYLIGYEKNVSGDVLAHELCHVMQVERGGIIKYVSKYIAEYISKGYRNVSFEIEARQVAEKYFQSIQKGDS
jgi:hypothetical protein